MVFARIRVLWLWVTLYFGMLTDGGLGGGGGPSLVAGEVTPIATGVNKGLKVMHTFSGNADTPYCIYDWGDDEIEIMPLGGSAESPTDSGHEYVNASYYSLQIICVTNTKVYTYDNDSVYAGDSITEFTISNATSDIILGIPPVTSDVVIGAQFLTGTDVTMIITVLGSGSETNITGYNAPDPEYVTFISSLFPSSGMYAVEVNATNPIADTIVTRHFVLAVEEKVEGVSLSSPDQSGDHYYFLVDTDNEIMTSLTAENPVFTWWLQDITGENLAAVTVEACEGTKTSNIYTIRHNTTGTFMLTQVITNHVNSVNTVLNVSFLYGVNSFNATLNKNIALYNENLSVTLTVLPDAMLKMGTVTCVLDFGDGDNITEVFDLTAESYDNISTENKEKQTAPKQLTAGWYYPTVVCSNGIPDGQQNLTLQLITVNPAENIVLSHNSPNISAHPSSDTLILTLTLNDSGDLPLANLTCKFTYDDTNSPVTVIGDITNGHPLNATILFSSGDKAYTIVWNCSNELTHMSDSLDVYVIFDCWDSSRYFDESVHNYSTPRVAYTHNLYLLSGNPQIKVPAVCLGNITSFFTVYSYNTANSQETFIQNITEPESLSSHTFPADTMQPGLYKVYLYTSFPDHDGQPILGDFLFIRFILPNLQISIVDSDKADNNKRSVIYTSAVLLDSYGSVDPAANLPGVAKATRSWTCQTSVDLVEDDIEKYFFSGTFSTPTSNCSAFFINNGDRTDLQYYSISGNQFNLGQWYVFQLTFASGDRNATKSVAVRTTEYETIVGEQVCRKGCFNGTGDTYKLVPGDFNVDLEIPITVTGLDIESVTYLWTFQYYSDSGDFIDYSDRIVDRQIKGMQIPENVMKELTDQGLHSFQLSCLTTATGHENTKISRQFVLNQAPYNGTCELQWESGAAVGNSEVKAGLEKVCMNCIDWRDEDEGALRYETTQIFLHANNTVDASTPAVTLAFNEFSKNCMLLSATNSSVNRVARIETKIRDEYSKPYALVQANVTVVPPIVDGVSGEQGAEQVQQFSEGFGPILAGAVSSDNTQAITSAVSAGGSAVKLSNLEGTTPVTVSDNQFVDFLEGGEPAQDATLTEVQSVNSNLTKVLKDVPVQDIGTGLQVAGSLLVISTAPPANVDGDSQNNLVDIFGSLANSTEDLNLADGSSVSLINSLVEAQGTIGNMIVSDTLSNTEVVSRELAEAEKAFRTTSDEDQEQTDDTKFFIAGKKQAYVALNKDELKNRSNQLDQNFGDLTLNVLDQTDPALSVGVQMTYSQGQNSDAISVKKNMASKFGKNPITSNNLAVYVEFDGVGGREEVTVAVAQSRSVLKIDDTERAADAKGQYKFVTKTNAQITSFVAIIQLEPVTLVTVIPVIAEEDASKFSYHLVMLKSKDDMLCITTQPAAEDAAYFVIWINKPSAISVSKIDFVAKESVNQANSYTFCFSNARRGSEIGNWKVGVEGKRTVSPIRKRRDTSNETYSLYPSYNFGVVTTACMVWDDNTDSWTSSSCDGKWNVTTNQLECNCPPQKTMTFSNSFYVAPNKIDFSSVFLKFSPLNQAAIIGTLSGVLIIYILVIIWSRRNDRKDLLKWGITPLLDNFAEDNYFYVIRVYTGMRPNSGTKSRIGMVIAGEEMDTGIRELFDGVRKDFSTGSVLNFLLSTTVYLGDLEYLRLWHDNSGGGNFASWYLSRIEVQDVQRNETFTFLAEKWLSVDEGCSLECVLPVAKNENLNIFKNRFFANAKSTLAESHIWVSVVYRPQTSNFTRVQRASCALVFVMLTMISNAMYFQSSDEPNYATPAEVQVGPFRFSLQQLYTSLICALITTSATLVVIYLFKLSRNKPYKDSVLFKPLEKPRSEKKYKIPYVAEWLDKEHEKSVELEKHLVEKGYPKFEGFYLPYKCRYIAWLMVFLSFVVCGFFLMLYSMEWGKQKSEEWLTTFFLSFFESVLCMDPVKVAVMALVFAILFRAASESAIVVDRQTIMRKYAGSHRGKSGGIRLPAPPLDHKRLDEERVLRQRELKMKTAFKDVVIQVFQIWILLSISFSNRDNKSYYMHKEIEESLLEPIGKASFSGIRTVEQYYDWLNNTVIPNAFPEDDYNGDRLHWRLRQFTAGGTKYRVGPPRLRQVRVPKDVCDIPYLGVVDCYMKYKSSMEDTTDFCIGWQPQPCDPKDSVYKFSADAWQFTSALDIWGLPLSGYYATYGGGGYISKLSVNREVSHLILNELYQYSWVDRQTRAVILEFTLYCLNVNIFTYNMFMIEFPETGGAFPFATILPLRVYQHTGALGTYTLACEIIFLLFLLIMTIMAIFGIYKQRRAYFSRPWQVYDLVFIIAGYVALAMYLARILMTHYALEVFREDKKEFVNFYHVAIWDQILVLLIGILVFLAIFRLLNILGYNKRIGAVARVFTNAAGDLLWFGLFFLTIFTCYAAFGYLLFGSALSSYKNVYRTMGTLFISMIGKSRFTEIEDTDPIMSKLYFMVFIFFVVYMILTMFLAILSQSIDKVHEETKHDKGDEMVDYLMKKFKRFLGYGQEDVGRPRNYAMYSSIPVAPWNLKKGRKFEYDNRQILEDIRMSLTDAMNMDPKEFSTPEPDKKGAKNLKKLRH